MGTTVNAEEFKKAILEIEALGATPSILASLIGMARDPKVQLDDVCDLIRRDALLTADILRISNSSYYSPARPHTNLLSAVTMVGLKEIMRIINLSFSRQMLARDLGSYGITDERYWTLSISGAVMMESLAKRMGTSTQDAYTVGLLHAIGRVVIDRVIEHLGFNTFWDGTQSLQEWELGAVGLDYAEAGSILLEKWKFPADIRDPIRDQLKPATVVDPLTLPGFLQFILRVMPLVGYNIEHADAPIPAEDPLVVRCKLTPEQLKDIFTRSKNELEKVRAAF